MTIVKDLKKKLNQSDIPLVKPIYTSEQMQNLIATLDEQTQIILGLTDELSKYVPDDIPGSVPDAEPAKLRVEIIR